MGQKSLIYKHCHFAVTAPKRKAVGSNPAGEAKKAGPRMGPCFFLSGRDSNGFGSELGPSGAQEPNPGPAPQRRSNPAPLAGAFCLKIVFYRAGH